MVSVPAFILRRLYVKGSLRNTEDGFRFELRNRLGSGYARQMLPLVVDGEEVPLEDTTFEVEGEEVSFAQVSAERPFTLPMNRSTVIKVRGTRLSPGVHTIVMGFQVAGLGTLKFDFKDAVADG